MRGLINSLKAAMQILALNINCLLRFFPLPLDKGKIMILQNHTSPVQNMMASDFRLWAFWPSFFLNDTHNTIAGGYAAY